METSRGDKTICLPFESEAQYEACMRNPELFRQAVTEAHKAHPELFPERFGDGFVLDGKRYSERQQVAVRRIKLRATGGKFSIRPSFLLPYMTATTDEVEKGLYLRHWNVPYDALAHVFGRPAMFWYRAELSLGRPSLVGTTVKDASHLPVHLVADEKHTELLGEKVFVPTVVGGGCILGATLSEAADTQALHAAYGEFATEARELSPKYAPKTVCTDGWEPTQSAFRTLFAGICVILCFLHSVLKIAERCVREQDLRKLLLDRAWGVYQACDRTTFSQRIRRFREWASKKLPDGSLKQMCLKLCSKREQFLRAFDHPDAHRTSNAVDRLIDHLYRRHFAMRTLHGTPRSDRLLVRSVALQWNFHPYGPRLRSDQPLRRSPFHDLNRFEYHPNWLHNLLIAASRGGHRP